MMLRRSRPALGTLVEIAVQNGDGALQAIEAAFACVESLEAQLSAHRQSSDLRRLCADAHQRAYRPQAALIEVLRAALELHRESSGIFDVVVGGGSQHIELAGDGTLRFSKPLRLDLGGIAKGYIVDRAIDCLQSAGVLAGRVNAGGDLRVFGPTSEPIHLRFADGFRCVAQLSDGAFAASRAGLRPMTDRDEAHHVDGRDQRPVRHADTVAVFAASAMHADALTKIALVCADTMNAVCARHHAQWRRYPFDLAGAPLADAA